MEPDPNKKKTKIPKNHQSKLNKLIFQKIFAHYLTQDKDKDKDKDRVLVYALVPPPLLDYLH